MQFYKDKLTIILTLKGREEFTFRYLKYLDNIKFPFRVLIADGSVPNLSFEAAIRKKENFPNVDYVYIRFPEDVTLMDFYNKVLGALEMVQTPYIMFNDNDDFPLPTGINYCIGFLEENKEYSGAVGKIGGVTLVNKLNERSTAYGEIHNFIEYYDNTGYATISYEQNSILERLAQQLLARSSMLCYSICHVKHFKSIYKFLIEYNINCLWLYEAFIKQGLLSYGKVKCFPNFYTYIRQNGSSQTSGSMENFWDLLYSKSWMDIFDRYAKALSVIISSINNENPEEVERSIRVLHSVVAKTKDFGMMSKSKKIKYTIELIRNFFKGKIYLLPIFLKKKWLSLRLQDKIGFEKKEFIYIADQIEKLVKNKEDV